MKRYLLTGVAILCMGLEASDNPFDLKTNLKNLDDEQSSLISELRDSVSDEDDLLLDEEIDTNEENITEESQSLEQNTSQSQEIKEESVEETPSSEEPADETVKKMPEENKVEEEKQPMPQVTFNDFNHLTLEQRVAREEARVKELAEERKQAEEARLKALEEERIAVQKYEAERLRKKQAQEVAKPKTVATITPKETSIPQEPQKATISEKAMEDAKREVEQPKVMTTTVSSQENIVQKSIIADINLTLEQQQAKEEADRLYLEAIKEVDVE